jgi:hypothetical protein
LRRHLRDRRFMRRAIAARAPRGVRHAFTLSRFLL